VRQWVLSVPKRLRYFLQRDGVVLNMVLRIFLRAIAPDARRQSMSMRADRNHDGDRAGLLEKQGHRVAAAPLDGDIDAAQYYMRVAR